MFNSPKDERARSAESFHEQAASDEEILDTAKVKKESIFDFNGKFKDLCQGVYDIAEALAGFKFYKYEKEFAWRVIESVVSGDGATITGHFSRQSGKSFTLAQLCPALTIMLPLYADYAMRGGVVSPLDKWRAGFWCGVYGPDYDRAAIIGTKINASIGSRQGRALLSSRPIEMKFPERLTRYLGHLPRNSFIYVKSANKRISIEGNTFHMVVTDETQEIDDYVLKKSISPMLAATLGTCVHLGSSYPKKVYFYDVIKTNKREDLERPRKKRYHFEYFYKTVQKYNPNYKKYIELEKKKLGEYSDEFRMSYEGYWPIEKGMFITEDILINMCGGDYSPAPSDRFNDHVIAIDLAKVLDSTVATVIQPLWDEPIILDKESRLVRYNKIIKDWLELSGTDYDKQFILLDDFLFNYKWTRLIIDATGVGAPMYDRFKNKYADDISKQVIPFVFSSQSKSEAYLMLYRELLAGRIKYPNSEKAKYMKKQQKFIQQMTNLSKDITNSGYLQIEPLEEQGHDDFAASLAMGVWAIEGEPYTFNSEQVENANIFKPRIANTITRRGVASPLRQVVDTKRNFWENN